VPLGLVRFHIESGKVDWLIIWGSQIALFALKLMYAQGINLRTLERVTSRRAGRGMPCAS
jgi:hypothetical protein